MATSFTAIGPPPPEDEAARARAAGTTGSETQNAGGALPPSTLTSLSGRTPPGQPQGTFQPLGGATPPPAPPPPPQQGSAVLPAQAPAAGGTDPAAAQQQLMSQFKTKFNRDMSPAEIAEFQRRIGYTAGGAITPEMMTQGGSLINQYSGNMADYGGAAPQQGGNLSDQMLRQLIETGSTPALSNVDPNNPAMVAQRAAFDRANSQATTRQRMAAGERGAARGTLGAGGFDAELAGIENNAGNQRANFESQLMRSELDGQRGRVMQGMLGGLDANIRREGMGSQERLGKGQLSLGLLQSLMGNQRAQDALGFNYTQLNQQGNQFDISQLLNQLGG